MTLGIVPTPTDDTKVIRHARGAAAVLREGGPMVSFDCGKCWYTIFRMPEPARFRDRHIYYCPECGAFNQER